ncbi:ABC transporter substrate-binding protein, partial [Kaarinaea lacus]
MGKSKPRTKYGAVARILFVCAIGCALVACSQPSDNVIRFGVASAPVSLDPRFATDATSERLNRLLYQRLVDFDVNQLPVPSLAKWQQLTPTHYRFMLLTEVRFHNGALLTSRDVKATYDYILNPTNASPHRTVLSLIEHIETPDSTTIDFFLRKADSLFPAYLVIGIMPYEHVASDQSLIQHPIGSGPFAFVQWRQTGRLLIQRRRDQQLFEIVHVPDTTVRVLKLVSGEVDMIQNDLSPELISYLQQQPKVQVMQGRGSNFSYLGFNLEDAVVGQAALRQAIAYALDRETIVKYLFGGGARLANALLPPDHWAGHPQLPQYQYDPEKAKSILRQAGFSENNPARIVYKTSTDPFRVRVATVIQQQLRQVGIQVQVRSYDWGTFYGDIKAGNFQMYSLSWIGVKTPDIFKYVFHSEAVPPHGANRGRFASS